MDERHWWIANKLQQTFKSDQLSSSNLAEDFLSDQDIIDKINEFIAADGSNKLIFYGQKAVQTEERMDSGPGKIQVSTSAIRLKDIFLDNSVSVIFTRTAIGHEIDPPSMEKEAFVLELKSNALSVFASLLTNAFLPFFKAQTNWGECYDHDVVEFLMHADRYAGTLQEYAAIITVPQHLLRRPNMQMASDLKHSRLVTVNHSVIAEYELLVQDWMQTIESLLSESIDENPDVFSGPLSELEIWQRRQRVLLSVADQLKNKECKTVIGILITTKSRVLKKWKVVDAGLTDAINETKDKVKYLESLRRYFDQLNDGYSPVHFANVTIPAIISAVRQMDNISKFYAKTGFLGVIFRKITNQLVMSCKRSINACLIQYSQKPSSNVWCAIESDISQSEDNYQLSTLHDSAVKTKRGTQQDAVVKQDFLSTLKSCLLLHKQYQDQLRHLKDSLGGTNALSHIPPTSLAMSAKKYNSPSLGSINAGSIKPPTSNLSPSLNSPDKGRVRSASSRTLTGIPFTDENAIIGYFDLFAQRVHDIIELIETLKQFSNLNVISSDLPIFDFEVLFTNSEESVIESEKPEGADKDKDEGSTAGSGSGEGTQCSDEEKDSDEEREDEPTESVTKVVSRHVDELTSLLKRDLASDTLLGIDGKGKINFEKTYSEFIKNVCEAETFIINYIKNTFKMKWKTMKALEILGSFKPVANRMALRSVLSEKYVEVFVGFEKDLDDTQQAYEAFKDDPPIERNAPKVAGSIFWSRGLLSRIEEPMKIFRDVKFVSTLRDFSRVVKYYHRVASALIKYEEIFLSAWKSQVEAVKIGLKAPLLRVNDDREIEVNVERRVLEVITEVKWMKRLNIQVPNTAVEIFQQETRVKNYYHQLHWVMKLYHEVCEKVPKPLRQVMAPLTESILYYLQPGLSTLTWSSLNIDAYLHQCHSAVQKLQKTVENVCQLVKDGLDDSIEKVKLLVFFDEKSVSAKTWKTGEFVSSQHEFCMRIAKKLAKLINSMESALQQTTGVVVQQMLISKVQSPPTTPGIINSTPTPTKLLISDSRSPSIDLLQHHKTGRNQPSPPVNLLDDAALADVKVYYCSQVYEAVLVAIRRSLHALINSLDWRQSESERFIVHDRENLKKTGIQFDVEVQFLLPDLCTKPSLDEVQLAINKVARDIVDISKTVHWWAKDSQKTFHSSILSDDSINGALERISLLVSGLQVYLDQILLSFKRFDFLWQDDLQYLFRAFSDSDPGLFAFHREVERLQQIEQDLVSTPDRIDLGSLVLSTIPVKDCLYGFAVAWKICYAQPIHESAKADLKVIVEKRESFRNQLTSEISSLDQLNGVLNLLQELHDLENTIDDLYLPVELTYKKLLAYDVNIARSEIEEVNGLRDKWTELLLFAAEIQWQLMQKKRSVFEQELDKQVKTFVVEVIQFRNSFDSQGPGVPGIIPSEAVRRLKLFHDQYRQLDHRRKVLDAVQIVFGIAPTPFPELDKTGEELEMLEMLYGLYQKFINFDQSFREQLWAEADLSKGNEEIDSYWKECLALPSAIRSWMAYKEMRDAIEAYIDVFPLLNKLASREIRNRHWLEVMAVTGTSFQLEANVFKLMHLLDSHLAEHKDEIEEIVQNAGKELDLEIRIRAIEEEWTEQVLNFEKFKNRGLVCLDKVNTEKLLEVSEDAKASLAIMLISKHVAPLREEAASWAVKLKEVGEVLEQWLSVQELWQCLEEVFSNSVTAKELPQESSRFARVDRTYMRTMKKAVEVRNVMQCCIGGDVPKNQMLKGLHEELEICFKSLAGYLNKKRKEFPRFYFVNDAALLNILSKPYNLDSVRPYLPAIFNGIHNIKVLAKHGRSSILKKPLTSDLSEAFSQSLDKKRFAGIERALSPIVDIKDEKTSLKFGRSLADKSLLFDQLGDEWRNELPQLKMVAVSDAIGELVTLDSEVLLVNGVESWLRSLSNQVTLTLENLMQECRIDIENGMPIEDCILKYPAQVSLMNFCHIWTMECEAGISEIRIDRKAMPIALRRYTNIFNKIPQIIIRGTWRNSDVPLSAVHNCRLESMISIGLYFRDVFEDLGKRKLRDISDFEWQRNMRLYFVNDDEGKGKLTLVLQMLDAKFDYGYEFLSCNFPVILTPLTERCFLSLTQAVTHGFVGCLFGPASTGKTQTIKGFSHILGRFLISLSCLEEFEPNSICRIFTGIAQEGAWCLFDELQQASNTTLSTVTFYIQHILNAIKSKQNFCYLLDSQQIPVMSTLSIFANVTKPTDSKFVLIEPASCLFRTISMIKPHFLTILRTHLASQGFKSYKMLADKIKTVEEICVNQLKTERHILFNTASMISVAKRAGQKRKLSQTRVNETESEATRISSAISTVNTFSTSGPKMQSRDRKLGTPVTLSAPVKVEHSIVIKSLIECIGSRMSQEEQVIFTSVVKDVFSHATDHLNVSANREEQEVEAVLLKVIEDKGLIGHPPWVSKAIQMFQLSNVFHGIVICGKGGSGKTSCIENLIEALNEHGASKQLEGGSKVRLHKLERINVLAVSDLCLMFGHMKSSGDWTDGVFTSIWKRSNKSHTVTATTTWLCFDAPVQNVWCKNLKSVLDEGKYLTLPNMERLPITGNIKILFETSSLEEADPAVVSRMGLVYMDDKILGWRPLADAWLEGRPTQHVHILQRAFRKVLDPVLAFMEQEARPCLRLSENVLFSSCLSLLTSLLQEHTDLGGDLHVERLFVFSLIWTFGGLLTREQDQKSFSQLLLAVSTALPDYDHYVSVFDYYVDESGEWDNWEARLPGITYADSLNLLDDVFVETVDSMRARFLMELVSSVDRNILLVGPKGCGKTCMIDDFYSNRDYKDTLVRKIAYSAGTTAAELQKFMESVLYHRQGFVYGAEDNKKMILFCDDLNVSTAKVKGNDFESANELLRQLLDSRMIFNLQKPFDRRFIEGLSITVALSTDQRSAESMALSDRLLRHFYIIQMPEQSGDTVRTIVSAILEANMCANDSVGLQQELQEQIINASCNLLQSVRDVLKPSPIAGRRNYQFSLRDLKRIFQALKNCPEENRADDENYLTIFWQHEARRVFQDRIVQTTDFNWFEETIRAITKEHFPSLPANSLSSLFATFAVDAHLVAQRSMTQIGRGVQRKITHQPLTGMDEVTSCLQAFLTRYNEQFNRSLPVVLYDQSLKNLIRIHRILTFKGSGNALLIGSIGTHISSLVELVLYMINIPIHPIDCANRSSFFDGLRSAVRTAGCEGKQIALLLNEKDLRDKSYLDAVNNILTNGSCPLLFTEEELRSLISALLPAIKKEHSRFLSDPLQFFEIKVKLNLHIIICMQPRNTIFRNLARDYPGILSACHFNWIMDWPSDVLNGELARYIEKHSLLDSINSHIIESVIRTMSGIHSKILKECNQIPWAGDYEENVSSESEMNLPHSKNILLHRIMDKDISWKGEQKGGIFVGPTKFHRFMHCFHYVFNAKAEEINEKVSKRRKALNALVQARANVTNLKEMITQLKAELGGTVQQTSELLNNLIAKATIRERLKAKLEKGSGTLRAFMELIDSEMDDNLADSVLLDDYDEMDEEYERIKVTQQLMRKSKPIDELLKDTEKEVEEREAELERSSEMVNMLQKKIDRGTIERLRAFQNPPPMVGMTMVMLMILLGRPEFASYVVHPPSKAERKQEAVSYSDEASRISSATSRRKRDQPNKHMYQHLGLTPDGRYVDKNAWKAIQVIMNDSQKFSEHVNNLKWENGLSDEILKTVVGFFAPAEETGRWGRSHQSGSNTRGSTTPKTANSERRQQYVTLAAARYSSEDAAQVVEYIQAVIDYSRRSKPYQQAVQSLKELKEEMEVIESKEKERALILSQQVPTEQPVQVNPIEGLTEEDLTRLDMEIEELREQFDEIAIQKFNLHQKISEYSEKLRSLTGLLESLKPVEAIWKYFLEQHSTMDVLLTNCVCASAFLTYCGPLRIDQRKRMSEFFLSTCKENRVPTESKKLFKDMSLAKFLVGKQMLQMWKAMSFPTDNISLDNICIMTQKDCCNSWALLCDPQRVAVHWIEKLLQDTTVVKYKELRGELESCLTEGRTLLLTDVDLVSLIENEKVNSLLRNKHLFIGANGPFKLMIGEEEVECSPSFRLFIITSSPAHLVPSGIAAYTNVVEFSQSRGGLAEQFLYRFIKLEKPRIHGTLYQVAQEIVTHMVAQEKAEEQLLFNLCSSDNPLSNFAAIKQVSGIKRFYDEAQESLTKAKNAELSIMNSRETYRSIAVCAAVLFDVSRSMSIVKPLYQISFNQFVSVFDFSIKHSDRNAVSAVVAKLQYNSFISRARGLFEEDRLLFALLVALEIEDSNNRIEVGEREFLISPPFGAVIRQLSNPNWEIPPKTLAKKPFDWLMDEQYHNLQLLAQYYPWFLDTFEKMPKDGRETQWRQIAEHDRPELLSLPDNLDEKFLPMHRLLVIRAVRGDRLMQAASVFITMALGRRYSADIPVDLLSLAKQAVPKSPILLLYRKESEICRTLVADFASSNQIQLQTIQLCGVHEEERFVKKAIKHSLTSGDWLLLLDGHNCLSLLESLESYFNEMTTVDSNFRLWISCNDQASFPSSLLQSSVIAVIESPKMNLRSSVTHNLQNIDSDVWKRFTRIEWLPLLHNVCMLHSTLKVRHGYGFVGLNLPYEFDFGIKRLWTSLDFLSNEFKDARISIPEGSTPSTPVSGLNQRGIQWHGLRYLLSEIVYGNSISNELDASVLASMVDLWISSSASRRDFEIPRAKYKLPATCFLPGAKQLAVIQAIESIPDNRLEMPEMCGLYSSDETPLSDDQYTFSRLNLILDCMPSSNTLLHVPPTSSTLAGTSVPLVVSSGTFHATGAGLLSLLDSSVFASASLTSLRTSAQSDLYEISTSALDKLPRIWSRVFVNERIRKLGGPSPFNLFLLSEIDCFYRLHQELRSSLQAIKLATSQESFGDKLPEEYMKDAEELYHLRIPERFRHLAGNSSPPNSWALTAWLSDLQARFNQMEKILYQGKEKIPAYWLAGFFNPKRMLAVVMQESVRQYQMQSAITEQFVFRTEITGRDKDHLREPSPDGMFIYGLYLWGCSWEKTTGELQDAPPKSGPSLLPVVHVTAVPYSEKASLVDPQKSQFAYECPCYASRTSSTQPIFYVDIEHKEVPSTKWPLRGICCTLRPF